MDAASCGGILGLGFGNFQSCAQAIALQGVKPERLGVATSTFFIFLDFGFGFGPYVLGLLVPIIGYQQLYLVLMVIVLIALGFFMLFSRMRQRPIVEQILINYTKRHYHSVWSVFSYVC